MPLRDKDGKKIVVRTKDVLDTTEFEAKVALPTYGPYKESFEVDPELIQQFLENPTPELEALLIVGGFTPTEEDPDYTVLAARYNRKKFAFTLLKSLEPSNIDWKRPR